MKTYKRDSTGEVTVYDSDLSCGENFTRTPAFQRLLADLNDRPYEPALSVTIPENAITIAPSRYGMLRSAGRWP